MVANDELLHDITLTNNPINVYCNAGKTTYHAPPHVVGHITPVPHEILAAHSNIHLTIDIMYINKIPFLITYS